MSESKGQEQRWTIWVDPRVRETGSAVGPPTGNTSIEVVPLSELARVQAERDRAQANYQIAHQAWLAAETRLSTLSKAAREVDRILQRRGYEGIDDPEVFEAAEALSTALASIDSGPQEVHAAGREEEEPASTSHDPAQAADKRGCS